MSLLSHARITSVRETIMDTEEVAIQANNYQMVMAYHVDDVRAEASRNWEFYIQEFKQDLIEAERTKIQNLMIGGLLFEDNFTTNAEEHEIRNDIKLLESEIR